MEEKIKIPKVIHYFWFGNNDFPDNFSKYLKSWKKNCPDYEIRLWNEKNFDVNICNYTKGAYQEKKYAFVSDYARCYILKKYGGVYLDTDVELLKNLDELLMQECFTGVEKNSNLVNPGLILASVKNNPFLIDMLEYYNSLEKFEFGKHTICDISTDILQKKYNYDRKKFNEIQKLKHITIYPSDYFCCKNVATGQIELTPNSYAIHHYDGSWLDPMHKEKHNLRMKLMEKSINKYGEKKGIKIAKIKYWTIFTLKHPIESYKDILRRLKNEK